MLRYLLSFTLFIGCGKPLKKKSEKDSSTSAATLKDQDQLNSKFIQAIQKKQLDAVRDLMEQGADINYNQSSTTPLLLAISLGHEKIASLLIEKGAELNQDDLFNGWNSLELSILNKMTTISDLLYKEGLEIESDLDLINELLKGNYKINFIKNIFKFNLNATGSINTAITYSREELISTLIQNHIEPQNMINSSLIFAIKSSNIKATKALLRYALVNFRDNLGKTALHYAAEKQDTSLVKILIKNGANASIENELDQDACDLAKGETRSALGCSLF